MNEPKRTQSWGRLLARVFAAVIVSGGGPVVLTAFGTIPAAVEDVVRESDLIVLGRVISRDPEAGMVPGSSGMFTRHSFKVEAYYKGQGPEEISLLTHGGVRKEEIGGKTVETYTQVTGAEGVRVGDEILAFLRAGPGGYYFAEWDGAKYPVKTDADTGDRFIELRLRKRRYMRATGQSWFDTLERMDKDPNSPIESELRVGKFLTETIPVQELSARLAEMIQGETPPGR